MNRKNAFTLAETLITIMLIGVVAMFTIPNVTKAKPNKDKIFYTKSIQSISAGINKIMDYNLMEEAGDLLADSMFTTSFLCSSLAEELNTSGKISCDSDGSYESPQFITADGVRFWHISGGSEFHCPAHEGRFNAKVCDKLTVYVDRDMSSKEKSKLKRDIGLPIEISADGRVSIPEDNDYVQALVRTLNEITK